MPENAPEGSIIAPLMIADKIYADHIASNAITSAKIAAGAVTADKINVTQLSAITSDVGVLHAGDYVDIGDGVLPDGSDGIYIKNGKFMVKNPDGEVVIDGTKNMLRIFLSGYVLLPPKTENNGINRIYFEGLGFRPAFLFYSAIGAAKYPVFYWTATGDVGEVAAVFDGVAEMRNYDSTPKMVRIILFEEMVF
ncbi:MAG: hypothetical protein WBI86_06915 [Defluviitoga tunisiensis]